MLKARLIASLLLYEGQIVQSIGFKTYLPIGNLAVAARYMRDWGADELLILDISATATEKKVNYDALSKSLIDIDIPVSVGGGITCLDDVCLAMDSGADKICINNALWNNSGVIDQIVQKFGSQCVVASVDAIEINKRFFVFDYLDKTPMETTIPDALLALEKRKIGEILLRSVDRDGSLSGLSLSLLNAAPKELSVPLILGGGASGVDDISKAFETHKVQAVAVGNVFHHSEHSIYNLKLALQELGVPQRIPKISLETQN